MNISIDFGFGYLKALSDSGKRVIFPSIAGELQSGGFDNTLSDNQLGIITDDGAWLFGDSAKEQSVFASHQQDKNWFTSMRYKAGVLLAITELTKASRVDVELMLSLPFEDFVESEVGPKIMTNLVGAHTVKRLGRDSHQQINITFPVRFPLFPQNLASLYVHLVDENGHFCLPDTLRDAIFIGTCNIGSETIELSTVKVYLTEDSFKPIGQRNQSNTESGGVYSLVSVIRQIIKEKYPRKQLKDHDIFNIIRTDTLEYGSSDIDISDLIAKPVKNFATAKYNLCTGYWGDGRPHPVTDLYMFILSGGGSDIVKSEFDRWNGLTQVMVSDEPQWDVVEGMRRLRKMLKSIEEIMREIEKE